MRHVAALCLVTAICGAGGALADSSIDTWLGVWRVTRGVGAPWTAGAPMRPETALVGSTLRFSPAQVEGPGVLKCTDARYTPTRTPAEGLFQGGLQAPAQLAAESLGIARLPADGFSLACSTGLFEFHAAAPDTLLLALDNVIWTLDRGAGALAAADSPEAAVQAFLEAHFAGPMGFDLESAALKRTRLGRTLRKSIDAYFERQRPADEVPPIDGDPFTDTQEYPTRFTVRAGAATAGGYDVPVDFADAYGEKRLTYLLVREDGKWRIDDVRGSQHTLREALAN